MNDKLQSFSLIDHMLCSPELIREQNCVRILLDGDNLSDHLAISCVCVMSVVCHHLRCCSVSPTCTTKLSWDKGDIYAYQSMLSQFLSNIALPTEVLLCKGKSCVCHYGLLQRYYSDIVNSLETAGNQCIPPVKVGVRKHWWSPDLDKLKQQ